MRYLIAAGCMLFIITLSATCALAQGAADEERPNLLVNPGFEDGEEGWEKRTPNDDKRVLSITAEAARTGEFGARIVNLQPDSSRWRQGAGAEMKIAPGSMIRLSGWIRTDLGPEGYAALRIYGMTDGGEITGQPTSRGVTEQSDWTRSSVNFTVPEDTDYVMAYLELPGAKGTADYDDLKLEVISEGSLREVKLDTLLLTDASEDDEMVQSLHTLYPRQVVDAAPGDEVDWGQYERAIAFTRGEDAEIDFARLEAFASAGGKVVVDLALYAEARGLTVQEAPVALDEALLQIAAEHPLTRGFRTGNTIPWYGGDKNAPVRRTLTGEAPGTVLAQTPDGAALLIHEEIGEGALLATDLTGLPEPVWNQPGSVNKYLFAGNLLGETVRYGRHFQSKLTYVEFVEMMRELAGRHEGLTLRDEGPAEEDYRLYSFQMGDANKPAMLVYGVAHGSEWEPAYGMFALVERLMEHPEEGLFDFDRYQLVVMPIVNPWGYDNRRRQNSNGVDLNRNAAQRWEQYQGRPNDQGVYGAGCYDFKGSGPFSEIATQTWKAMVDRVDPHAALDFHGNAGGAGNNRLIMIPATGAEGNEDLAHEAVRRFNEAIADRYILLESRRPGVQQYEIESISWGSPRPTLTSYACQDRLGFICEVPAGYSGTYGIVFQTDVVIETILGFFRAYE